MTQERDEGCIYVCARSVIQVYCRCPHLGGKLDAFDLMHPSNVSGVQYIFENFAHPPQTQLFLLPDC